MSTCPKRLDTALQTVRFSLSAHAKCWVMSERALFSAKSGWARCPARLLVVLVQSPHSPCFRHAKVKGYFPYTQEFGVFFFHSFLPGSSPLYTSMGLFIPMLMCGRFQLWNAIAALISAFAWP